METYPAEITKRYKITDFSLKGQALMEAVCRGRGFLLRGGELDIDRACAIVLDEFRDGKLGRITLERPPVIESQPERSDPIESRPS